MACECGEWIDDYEEQRAEARRRARRSTGAIAAMVLVGFKMLFVFFTYGTVSPCGILKQESRAFMRGWVDTNLSGSSWEGIGALVGNTLAGAALNAYVDGYQPLKCIQALVRLRNRGTAAKDVNTKGTTALIDNMQRINDLLAAQLSVMLDPRKLRPGR